MILALQTEQCCVFADTSLPHALYSAFQMIEPVWSVISCGVPKWSQW
ncbi:hypothetical protein [Acinetobacter bereziniae]|nr:hypothetical protein [Acinetobacter bereziniae]